ncbi:hypothetical protein ACQPZU_07075 [Saccharomonospora azurea]|nr:hypothetical protein [Saccharomonospora azurea]
MSQPWQPSNQQPPQQPAPGQWPSQTPPPGQAYPQQAPPQQGQPFPQATPPPASPQQGQPFPQAYPAQAPSPQPYPGQPYPGQPYAGQPYPGQPYPGGPMPGQFHQGPVTQGPLTLPGWGAVPAILGVVASVVGLLLLPWVSVEQGTLSFLDLTGMPTDNLFTMPDMYVAWLAFVALALQPLYPLPWTLGAVRTQKVANLMQGWPRTQLTHATFTRFRLVFGTSAFAGTIIHGLGIVTLYDGAFELAGAGPWVLLAGTVLTTVGAVVGPRKGPGLPPA